MRMAKKQKIIHVSKSQAFFIARVGLFILVILAVTIFATSMNLGYKSRADGGETNNTFQRQDGTVLGPGTYQTDQNNPIILTAPNGIELTLSSPAVITIHNDGSYDYSYDGRTVPGSNNTVGIGEGDAVYGGVPWGSFPNMGMHGPNNGYGGRGHSEGVGELLYETKSSGIMEEIKGFFSELGHGLGTFAPEVQNGIDINSGDAGTNGGGGGGVEGMQ